MITRVLCFLLVLSAATVALPAAADAQSIADRLKAKAREEALRRTEDLLRNAVRCVANDTTCVTAAKASGKRVVLTDASGKVLTDAKGEPVTDPKQLPQQPPASVATTRSTQSQLTPDTSRASAEGGFQATATGWDMPDGSGRVGRTTFDGFAQVRSAVRSGNHPMYILTLRSAEASGPAITLYMGTTAPGRYAISRHSPTNMRNWPPARNDGNVRVGITDIHYGPGGDMALENGGGWLQISSSSAGVLVGTGQLTWPRNAGGSAEMFVSFSASMEDSVKANPAPAGANARPAAGTLAIPASSDDWRFVGSATNWINADGSASEGRTDLVGSATVAPRVSYNAIAGLHESGYLISLETDDGRAVLLMSAATVAPGSYEIGQQVSIDSRGYGPPRGSLRIESATNGILVGSVNVTFPTAYRPGWAVDASFRAGLREPSGRAASYEPSYPLGLDNLVAAIAELPAARQAEIRRVYDAAISISSYRHDAGCLAQASLGRQGNTPFDAQSPLAGLPFHECILIRSVFGTFDTRVADVSRLPNSTAVAAASPTRRLQYRNCIVDGMTDVWVETSISSGGNWQYADNLAGKAYIEISTTCRQRYLGP